MQQEIKDLLFQFGILWKSLAIMGGLIGTAFGASFAYIKSVRGSIQQLNAATFDQLADDNAKMASSISELYERARKNENGITALTGDIKRIDEKCDMICKSEKWDGRDRRRQ